MRARRFVKPNMTKLNAMSLLQLSPSNWAKAKVLPKWISLLDPVHDAVVLGHAALPAGALQPWKDGFFF